MLSFRTACMKLLLLARLFGCAVAAGGRRVRCLLFPALVGGGGAGGSAGLYGSWRRFGSAVASACDRRERGMALRRENVAPPRRRGGTKNATPLRSFISLTAKEHGGGVGMGDIKMGGTVTLRGVDGALVAEATADGGAHQRSVAAWRHGCGCTAHQR